MSEASRNAALAHAIALHSGQAGVEPADIVSTAAAFHEFIMAENEAAKPPAKAGAPKSTPPKAASSTAEKPTKKTIVKERVEPEEEDAADPEDATDSEDETTGEVTREEVGEALAALIDNDQKDDAIAILKKYGAKSLSSLASKHYVAAKAAAEKKLSIV